MTIEELKQLALEMVDLAIATFSEAAVLIQLGLIAVLFPIAWFLSNRVEPLLEERARSIKGMPGLLRVIIAFMRRFEWVFFIILLLLAYVATTVTAWPGSNYLIYAAMLLSTAWLLIAVVSHTIRSKTVRKFFAWIAWLYVSALILGIVDDVAALLDGAGFSVGSVRCV